MQRGMLKLNLDTRLMSQIDISLCQRNKIHRVTGLQPEVFQKIKMSGMLSPCTRIVFLNVSAINDFEKTNC